MLQRIQTLYLLLAIVAIALTFVFDLCQYTVGERSFVMDLYSIVELSSSEKVATPAYSLLTVLLLTLTELILIGTLFSYKRRKLQLKLIHLNYLLLAGTIVLLFFGMEHSVERLPVENGTVSIGYGMGWLMPAVAVAFSFLAARGVKKDEELVRSVDRLR